MNRPKETKVNPSEIIIAEKGEKLSSLNLLVNREATVEAIQRLEGEGMMDEQSKYKLPAAFEFLAEAQNRLSGMADEDKQNFMSSFFILYGASGFHRYFIYPDGRVRFSAMHSREPAQKQATGLGFEVS